MEHLYNWSRQEVWRNPHGSFPCRAKWRSNLTRWNQSIEASDRSRLQIAVSWHKFFNIALRPWNVSLPLWERVASIDARRDSLYRISCIEADRPSTLHAPYQKRKCSLIDPNNPSINVSSYVFFRQAYNILLEVTTPIIRSDQRRGKTITVAGSMST